MLAGLQGGLHHLKMLGHRDRHDDRVDLGRGDEVLGAGKGMGDV